MSIIFALLVFLFIYANNAPIREHDRQAKENYKEMCDGFHKSNRECAKRNDCYYRYNEIVSAEINENFWPDGSLKRDVYTGATYKKGQYYVNSRGYDADQQVDNSKKRPG